ncbi:MAG: hypothetical protein JSR28_20375 [Proteobacteria bacterium]|nr:hypothetical protein [Pseudomonadota bacterium]
MTNETTLRAGKIAAAWDWWRDAGVDCDFADEPTAWLAEVPKDVAIEAPAALVAPRPVVPAAPPRPRIGGTAEAWPRTLDDFSAWWLAEPSLDDGRIEGRVAPRGIAGAKLMILVDHPEAEDTERLLAGPQGRMLASLLRALGLGEDQTYVASALPRHMPMPDWAALAADGLGTLTAHHIALARPQRLLVFGSNVSSLLGHDPAKSDGFLPIFDHEAPRIPALVAPGLTALAARPRGKARLWQALLDWTGVE